MAVGGGLGSPLRARLAWPGATTPQAWSTTNYLSAGIRDAKSTFEVPHRLLSKSRAILELPSLLHGRIAKLPLRVAVIVGLLNVLEYGKCFESVRVVAEGGVKPAKVRRSDGQAQAGVQRGVQFQASSSYYQAYLLIGRILEMLEPGVEPEARKYGFYNGQGEGEATLNFAYELATTTGYVEGRAKNLDQGGKQEAAPTCVLRRMC